ncbi:MAG: four-carbon acid sugar kinase family protein [Anaerolineae bacterium]|nr:four-carbon acid sugar kinase family protein [Anaerolineae bacterium]
MIIGVVADDITGANDIGIMFAKSGYLAHVYRYDSIEGVDLAVPDVCIIDTNSRLDPAAVAYNKVYAATKALQQAGCQQFHNKTCSVFRGNIGAEFDAMLDALGQEFAVVILGFPKNGRITVDGIHYVHGVRLEESEFQRDPVHPMRQSNLVDILQAQTKRRVGLINAETIRQGKLRPTLEQMRSDYNYVILDVADQQMLTTIAVAVYDYPVLCGSSAIAEALPAHWQKSHNAQTIPIPPSTGAGVLCAAGSLMPQTAAQVDFLQKQGVPTFTLNPLRLFSDQAQELNALVDKLVATLNEGKDVLFHPESTPEIVDEMRSVGAERGLSLAEVSRLVSTAIAEVVAMTIKRTRVNRLLIAGGETSAAVCQRLGIKGLQIYEEIQPGLPICLSLEAPPTLLVLKSGSFGSSDFFAKAIQRLKQSEPD